MEDHASPRSGHSGPPQANLMLEVPRIKLILVGQENVGKTSLLRAMRDALAWRKANALARRFNLAASRRRAESAVGPGSSRAGHNQVTGDTLSTDGIDVEQLTVETKNDHGSGVRAVNFTVFDFAGQDIYYTTHSFFLSERSIFVIVWNLCDEANLTTQLQYWLNSIRVHAPRAPIVLVGTHLDGRKGTRSETEEYMRGIFKRFKKEFPRVRAFHGVSCSTGRGAEELLRSLEIIALAEPCVTQPVPVSHTIFEAFLLMERNVYEQIGLQPILTWSEIISIAYKCKILPASTLRNQEEQENLEAALEYAHLLGSIYYFRAEEESKRLVILDPQWIAKVFASVISTKHLFASKGMLPVRLLTEQIWRDYPSDTHNSILELFENFEVMFRLPASAAGLSSDQGDVVIIPSTLPKNRPDDLVTQWPTLEVSKVAYTRQYRFEFIPNGLFSRYMVRLTRLGNVLRYWQYGVLVQHARKSAMALVELKPTANLLQVSVRGSDQTAVDMFCTLVELLEFLLVNWFRVQTDIVYIDPRTRAQFTQQQLEEASLSGSWILEADVHDEANVMAEMGHVVRVKMDAVAPELALNNLHALEIDVDKDIKISDVIGEGAYATVYKANLLATGEDVAVKRLRMQSADYAESADIKAAFNEFRREVMVMSELKHPNIVKLIGFSLQVPFSMVMELATQDALYKYLEHHKETSWEFRLRVAYDIAQALAFLHSIDYQHRDLKSPNILLSDLDPFAPVVAKVSDFGITGRMYAQQSKAKLQDGREVQNPTWLAPEVLRGEPTSTLTDVYPFGIILWELLTSKHPFEEYDFKFTIDLEEAIKAGKRPTIPADCPSKLAALIADCWAATPKSRPSYQEIANHRLPEIMRELVPNLAEKLEELKAEARALLEKQRHELESIFNEQKQQMKQLEEMRDRQLRNESSDELDTEGDEEDSEPDGGSNSSDDDDGDDGDDVPVAEVKLPRSPRKDKEKQKEKGKDKEKDKSKGLSKSPRSSKSEEPQPSPREIPTNLTSLSPSNTTPAATEGLGGLGDVVSPGTSPGLARAGSKKLKGARKKHTSRELDSPSTMSSDDPASREDSSVDGSPFTEPRQTRSANSTSNFKQVAGAIRGAFGALKKFGSGTFGSAGDSTLGNSSSSSSDSTDSSNTAHPRIEIDALSTGDSIAAPKTGTQSNSGGLGRGSKPGLLQSTNSAIGGMINDIFARNAIGFTRANLGGYWRMMEGELRDLIDQRGLILDPAAPQTKADLVQVLLDDDAAIAKMRLSGLSSTSSSLQLQSKSSKKQLSAGNLVTSPPSSLSASGAPSPASPSMNASAQSAGGSSVSMQYETRDVSTNFTAVTASFQQEALWRRVKYYVTVSNSVLELHDNGSNSGISLRDSLSNSSASSSGSGAGSSSGSNSGGFFRSLSTSSRERGRARSGTVGGGPLPNSGGVDIPYGLDPLVELLLSSDEKVRWNTLASITVLIENMQTRKQLLDSGLVQILMRMFIDLVKSNKSSSLASSNPTDFEKEERAARRQSRLRSVILAILVNLTSTQELSISPEDTEPPTLPACLTQETELRMLVRMLVHANEELKLLHSTRRGESKNGFADGVIQSPSSVSGSSASVRAELVAAIALLANISCWSEKAAELLATSEAIAREVTRGEPTQSNSATVDLFVGFLEDSATIPAAATILANISAKDEKLCSIVGTRSLVRKCVRALRRQPAPSAEAILTVVSLLRNCSSIQTLARYMSGEKTTDALNELPFNTSLEQIINAVVTNIKEASPEAAMRRKRSLTRKKLAADVEPAEALLKHKFVLHSFKSFHWCMLCSKFVWGLKKQGYRCTVCHYSAHEACIALVDTPCPGYVITQPQKGESPPMGPKFSSEPSSSGLVKK